MITVPIIREERCTDMKCQMVHVHLVGELHIEVEEGSMPPRHYETKEIVGLIPKTDTWIDRLTGVRTVETRSRYYRLVPIPTIVGPKWGYKER